MAKQLSVLLLEDVANIGRAGEVVSVAEGYARNLLFPEGKAALATGAVRTRAQHQAKVAQRKEQKELEEMQAQAQALEGTELIFQVRVKDGLDIYGSVGKAEIAQRLHQEARIEVKPKDILLPGALKKIGSSDVVLQLSPEVECTIRITLNPQAE
jgi:large subunit ribosomal protein L9